MIVVADSSPLHYLVLIEQTALLPEMYGDVMIPDAVAAELTAPGSPDEIRDWMSDRPSWLTVLSVSPDAVERISDSLDLGERAAIALAERERADLLLMDDSDGRREDESLIQREFGRWL